MNRSVIFSSEEFQKHESKVETVSKRKRLLVDFHDALTLKLQNCSPLNCWLVAKYNWFNKKLFWKALYKCLDKHCECEFSCLIENKPERNQDVLVKITQYGFSTHEKINKFRRCVREERALLGLELLGKSVSTIRDEHIIHNHENVEDNKSNYKKNNYI